ncbi:hypothetical protein [Hymenobacter cavernae]|uniref:Phospholipase n=1 Tax=Hymenobacter cavernae TaxID=2044852 RepID=A0ABQ1UEF5_9BACT|nr:hypothetical protein [Hymenobacter cavernae]GGF16089.1 hypothetical protein GCM10011383_29320 [Hymenobacter cavernae]
MAEINIQRKKARPSPWLLILLLLVVLGIVGYFLFRSGSETEQPVPPATGNSAPATTATSSPSDGPTLPADEAVASMAAQEPAATPDDLASFAITQTTQPDYGHRGLRMLSGILIDLADREDLRDNAVSEKRDNLTSATSRLEEENSSLRPGCVAAAAVMQAMQQKAYPNLERSVAELNEQALQLSGRTTTADLESLRNFFTRAAEIAKVLSQPSA